MKVREIVARQLKLGDRVWYTHRAATSSGRDTPGGRLPSAALTNYAPPNPPRRFGEGRYAEQARWVIVWPETGYGTLTGLTYRAEGVISPGYDDGQGYLSEHERWPLYEVKTALRGRPLLIPLFACFPLKWIGGDYQVSAIDDYTPTPMDGRMIEECVDSFLLTAPEKVT